MTSSRKYLVGEYLANALANGCTPFHFNLLYNFQFSTGIKLNLIAIYGLINVMHVIIFIE